MKKALSHLGLKIGAIVVLTVMMVVLLLSCLGTGYMIYKNVYADGGEKARSDHFSAVMHSKGQRAVDYYSAVQNGDASAVIEDKEYFSKENSNYFFTIRDEEHQILMQSYSADYQYKESSAFSYYRNRKDNDQNLSFESSEKRDEYVQYCLDHYGDVSYDYYSDDIDYEPMYKYTLHIQYVTGEKHTVQVDGFIRSQLTAKDDIFYPMYWLGRLLSMRVFLPMLAVASFLICAVLFIFLLCSAGHKTGVEGIHLNWADRIPFDLYVAGLVVIVALLAVIVQSFGTEIIFRVAAVCLYLVIWLLFLALLLSFATRAKTGTAWWRNTILFRLLRFIGRLLRKALHGMRYLLRSLPFIGKAAGILGVLLFVNILAMGVLGFWANLPLKLFWFIELCVAIPVILLMARSFRELQISSRKMADGQLDTPVDTRHMWSDCREIGENLNHISAGLSKAVGESVKAERFKTELITNVSHDIKTPLTSIISYVDLIKKEEPESERLREYVAVLDRQSIRLKKLIEDLIEASKASTGNLAVHLVPCEIGVLLTQTIGEYQEKAAARQLDLVLEQPNEPVRILADGRHLWRVFDNLMNNICKYSQESTRVYLSVQTVDDTVRIIFRNISKNALNIRSEELMERFVRGDSSRNTEGSGLGLSIARSLTELQHGALDVYIDGDLFKAVLTFPLLRDEEMPKS